MVAGQCRSKLRVRGPARQRAAWLIANDVGSEVLLKLNETSLSQLRRDHETGHLDRKIVNASK